MNLAKLILASVAVRGVYRRFAELSEEEKAQVVEKVKQKLKEKYPEADGAGDSDTVKVSVPVEGEAPAAEAAPTEEAPAGESSDTEDKPDADDNAGGETKANPESVEEEPAENIGDTTLVVDEPENAAAESEDVETELEEPKKFSDEDEESDEIDESAAVSAEPGTPMGDIADDIAEDVDEIREEGKVDPAHVIDLFGDMMQMVTLLVRSTPPDEDDGEFDEERTSRRVAEACVADRVTITALRGQQLNRKDKDLMSDTGGTSKGPGREPDLKPPRDDVRKPFRTKNKPADERDPDTDSDPDLKG